MGWLAYEPHGDLWSVVLTQRVKKGEALAAAKRRMAVKERAFMRWCVGRGATAGMATTHVPWSQRADGWHYHVHTLWEFPPGCVTAEMSDQAGHTSRCDLWDKWRDICNGDPPEAPQGAVRRIAAAGAAIVALREDGGDPEFWKESRDLAARAIQYPMRDMAQGISASRLGGDPERMEAAAEEFVTQAAGWKMYRAVGKWRKVCPAAAAVSAAAKAGEAATAKDEGKKAPACPPKGEALGTVRAVWFAARKREPWAVQALKDFERSVSNSSEFAKRFVKWCRAGWDPGGA